MTSLVIAEHDNVSLKDATHKTVTAAAAISSPVHILVAGENCAAVAEAAAKIAGVEKVLLADSPIYARMLAEPMEALVLSLADKYDALLAPATTTGHASCASDTPAERITAYARLSDSRPNAASIAMSHAIGTASVTMYARLYAMSSTSAPSGSPRPTSSGR